MDQPRDIHGTPIYVGDRVAIAVDNPGRDSFGNRLIVRCVDKIDGNFLYYPAADGHEGCLHVGWSGRVVLRLA